MKSPAHRKYSSNHFSLQYYSGLLTGLSTSSLAPHPATPYCVCACHVCSLNSSVAPISLGKSPGPYNGLRCPTPADSWLPLSSCLLRFALALSASAILAFCCSLSIYQLCPYLRTFAFAAPSAWNKLPSDICWARSFASFRCLLQCHLLSETPPPNQPLSVFHIKTSCPDTPYSPAQIIVTLRFIARTSVPRRQDFCASSLLLSPQCLEQSLVQSVLSYFLTE